MQHFNETAQRLSQGLWDPRRGQLPPGHSELPDADSLFLWSDPPRDVPGRGGVVNVLQSCSRGPQGPGLPYWGQCPWYLWWLFRNPYLIDNTYPQEELAQNCSELRNQVKLHNFTQVGVVHRSVCFKLEVGEKGRDQIRQGATFSGTSFSKEFISPWNFLQYWCFYLLFKKLVGKICKLECLLVMFNSKHKFFGDSFATKVNVHFSKADSPSEPGFHYLDPLFQHSCPQNPCSTLTTTCVVSTSAFLNWGSLREREREP